MASGRSLAIRLATASLSLTWGLALAEPGAFDPGRARWAELEFRAAKFLMSATARVEARMRPSAAIAAELVTTPAGTPVAPGPEVLEMVYRASGLGRESVTTLWADPVSGATLQRTQLDSGERQRTYRFTDSGAYHYTRWPATRGEEDLSPARWTERTEGMRPYSPGAIGKPVTEATVLLWLTSAADLEDAGDRIEVLTFSRKHVNRVVVEVAGRRRLDVAYDERSPAGSRQRKGKVDAILLRIHGAPLDPDPSGDDDFELLGLRGDLELWLDAGTRVPLELRGDVKIAGKLAVKLRRAVLR
jgi:hypothetical protein